MFFSFLKTQIFASFFTASLAIFLVTVLVLFVFLKIKKLSINKATWGLPLLFLVVAIGSYNLPEKYQLLNLINVSENTNTNQDLMNQTPTAIHTSSAPAGATAVKGEETNSPKDALQCVSTGCTNLYTLLNPEENRRVRQSADASLRLGGILLTPHGELFILSHSIISDSIKRHTIRNINLADDSITSRTIKDHEIKRADLSNSLEDDIYNQNYLTSYSETDPLYSAWNKSTGITIQEAQISDLQNYLTGTKVDSFNTRTGAITLTSSDVTTALTYTPYNSTNPNGYISSYTESDPIFSAWNKSTGITIQEAQITNLQNYLTSYTETDPNVSAWAKNATKPTYTATEVGLGNVPNLSFSGSNTGDQDLTGLTHSNRTALDLVTGSNTGDNATNSQYSSLATSKQDALNGTGFVKITGTTISYDNSTYVTGTPWTAMGYLTSYTETDPNVSAWAKNATKPTYTASEVNLGNVTNESKATMFSSPTFTGTVSGITATMVGLSNVPNLSFSGSNTGDQDLTGLTHTNRTALDLVTGSNTGDQTNISGNAATVTNGVYLNSANSMTLINPLTTLAESWIGPSATTGNYFKGGNIGIGTTNPLRKLEIVDNSNLQVARLTGSDTDTGLSLNNTASGGHAYTLYSSGTGSSIGAGNFNIYDDSASLSRFTINSSGSVGIGTTNPLSKLQIYTGDGTSGLRTSLICSNSTTSKLITDANGSLICGTDQTGSGTGNIVDTLEATLGAGNDANGTGIINLGNVGIGTTTATTKLEVAGVITATGGTSTNWNTAYGWGNHAGLYLPIGGGTLTGDLALTTHNLTLTGSIADTTNRVTKLWATNVEITNLPTISGGTLATALSLGSAAYTNSTAYDVSGAAAAITPTTLGLVSAPTSRLTTPT